MTATEFDSPVAQFESAGSNQEGTGAAARPVVLVVDDNPLDCRLACATLEKHANVKTITANNGKAALLAIARQMPTVVLTDLQMPEMGGLELTEIIRDKYPEVPVILMTANGSEDIAFE